MKNVDKIDRKLIEKYDCDKSKYERARLKKKKIANFYYLRFHNVFLILHTEGDIRDNIVYDDKFKDIRDKKSQISIKISDLTTIDIFMGAFKKGGTRKVTVKLNKSTYRGIKDSLYIAARTKNINLMKREFDKLNGYPAWSGIIEQKVKLAKYLEKQARSHRVDLKKEDLRINCYRKPVTVFKEG